MTTEEVKANIDYHFIKSWLEYGQRQSIAEKNGLTRDLGYKILSGERFHRKFLEDCYQAAIENANKWLAQREQVRILKEKLQRA